MATATDRLLAHYDELSSRWTVSEREADYGSLVTPTGNQSEPFHRWFRFKEAYSHGLFDRLTKDADWTTTKAFEVLDPFAGSGTTLLSALEVARGNSVDVSLHGVERNPLMQLVANAKLTAATSPAGIADDIPDELRRFQTSYFRRLKHESLSTPSPTLSNEKYFSSEATRSLIALGRAARDVENPVVQQIFRACVAASVEPCGLLRKDGRALRFTPDKVVMEPMAAFRAALEIVFEDIANCSSHTSSSATLLLGDARDPFVYPGSTDVSWAVFSPPYPNNIDYTEVYKIEAWALEMYEGPSQLREQRLATLRSHPSVLFPETYHYPTLGLSRDIDALLEPLLDAIPHDRYAKGRRQVIQGYVDDMLQVLINTRHVMAADGRAAVVVGNSAHGQDHDQFVVAADLLIARAAEMAGWDVEEIRIARRPRRRPDPHGWLRESVVVLQPSRARPTPPRVGDQ